ncbi:MAG: hypothetical protein PW792_08085 [Acidobacteriaceae bacterium]|nr:hypothetical protein [Acidobacteriaceae bacterium]
MRAALALACVSVVAMPCFVQAQTPAKQAQAEVRMLAEGMVSKPVSGYDAVALLAAWHETADGRYFKAVQDAVERGQAPLEAAVVVDEVLATKKYNDALAELQKQPKPMVKMSADAHMAHLVDLLERTPEDAAARKELNDLAKTADPLDALRVYALAKGARLGFLPASDEARAVKLWAKVPMSAPASARLLAATEIAQSETALSARGKRVAVDAWFNSQTRTGLDGKTELFHYKWDDQRNSGFSFFGRAFQREGAKLETIAAAPTAANLKGVSVYVIASPDIPSKNPNPHYMDKSSGDAIEAWVKAGGVLLLMQNDKTNAEFEKFNTLADRFGVHFNPVLRNTVEGHHYEQGRVEIPAGTGGIFPAAIQAYMKEICTIAPSGPGKAVLTDKGDVLMAVAHVGKGTVYAVVDPWLYNEYTDGQKLPPEYPNFTAAKDLAKWALEQAR